MAVADTPVMLSVCLRKSRARASSGCGETQPHRPAHARDEPMVASPSNLLYWLPKEIVEMPPESEFSFPRSGMSSHSSTIPFPQELLAISIMRLCPSPLSRTESGEWI